VETGAFRDEVFPVRLKDRKKGEIAFDTEEIPRADTSLDRLAALEPIFTKGGTVTAGTSSALCDAGSALVVADGEWAAAQGLRPMAEILGYASAACAPDHMGLGPVYAVPKALQRSGFALEDMELIELNEAFAAQVLAVHRALPFDMDRCNVRGGAIAWGILSAPRERRFSPHFSTHSVRWTRNSDLPPPALAEDRVWLSSSVA
jgi:acetyl-CoA C-acetyltransferase